MLCQTPSSHNQEGNPSTSEKLNTSSLGDKSLVICGKINKIFNILLVYDQTASKWNDDACLKNMLN